MATAAQIASLRTMVNEPTTTVYTDVALTAIIDGNASLEASASVVWNQKAARYAELVDVREGNSSRSLGNLYDQALKMSSHYSAAADALVVRVGKGTKIRLIERT